MVGERGTGVKRHRRLGGTGRLPTEFDTPDIWRIVGGEMGLRQARAGTAWQHFWSAGGRLRPVFQPIVSLADGGVFAYEALSRPHLPGGAAPSILHLVQEAQAAGAEADLDERALAALAPRLGRLPPGAALFVNVSPVTVWERPEVLDPLRALGGRAVLEMTERTPVPEGRVREFLRRIDSLRRDGVRVAVDDCGAGYSGLNRLAWLRPDFAKIDMELVRRVDRDGAKASLVEALVLFAHRSGIDVIAEGVETEGERDALADLGVRLMQGYLAARPAPSFRPVAVSRARAQPPGVAVDAKAALGAGFRLARLAVRGLGDEAGLHEAIVQAVRRAVEADSVILWRRAGARLEAAAWTGRAGVRPAAVDLARGTWMAAALEGPPAVRQTRAEGEGATPYGSALAAAVGEGDGTWGVLSVAFVEEHRVRAELVDLVAGIADQVALILLARGQDRPAADRSALAAARYLAVHPGDWSDLLARAVRDLEAETGSHDAWLGVVRGDRLWIVPGSGAPVATALADWVGPEGGRSRMPPGVALREGRAVVVPDVRLEPSLAAEADDLLAQGIISAAAVPLVAGGEVVGVLKVYHSARGHFTPERVRYLREAADVLALLVRRWGGEG